MRPPDASNEEPMRVPTSPRMGSRLLATACVAFVTLVGCGSDATSDDDTAAGDTATSDAASDGGDDGQGGDVSTGHPSLAWAVDQAGPHNIGHKLMTITYEGAGGIGKRTVPLHIWYPTEASSGSHPAPYGQVLADPYSWEDVPASKPDAGTTWPVMVYSHGHQGFAGSSAFVPWHFASHGWVVAAPDHVGNLLSDAILPRPTWIYYARSLDISATIDRVAALGDGDGFGAGKADTTRVLLTGHSFGVHTCWSAAGASFDIPLIQEDCKADGGMIVKDDCSESALAVFAKGLRDERIVAAVPMAGTMHRGLNGPEGHKTAKIPVLSLSGTKDLIGADKQFDECTGCDLTWVELKDATHQSFGLTCSQVGTKDISCVETRRWALAMGRRYVLDDPSVIPLLEGETTRSDVVTNFKRRKP